MALFLPHRLFYRLYDAIVVFGMLLVVFRRHLVAATSGIASESLIFFINLPSVAAHANVGAVAVEGLVAHGCRRARLTVAAAHLGIAAAVASALAAGAAAVMPSTAAAARPAAPHRTTLSHV